jgi:hypothetical protein
VKKKDKRKKMKEKETLPGPTQRAGPSRNEEEIGFLDEWDKKMSTMGRVAKNSSQPVSKFWSTKVVR